MILLKIKIKKMEKKLKTNDLLYHLGQKTIKTALNIPQKQSKPKKVDPFRPLNKEQVEKLLSFEQSEDILENEYEPESDPNPIVIFDSELISVEELKAVDIVFLVDTTASMNCYLKGIKRVMRKIIWDIERCLSQFIFDEVDVLKVGLVTYKDHNEENKTYLTKVDIDLTDNLNDVINKILEIKCEGGGDEPESVEDGLNTAINKVGWRKESVKFLYHFLDAPPHGKKYNNCEFDKYDECPNKIDLEELLVDMRNKDIKYSLIKLNDSLDTMIQEFQKIIDIELLSPDKVYVDKRDFMLQE
jgi:hypothetical protein